MPGPRTNLSNCPTADARDKRGRKLLAENIDPGTVRYVHVGAAKKTAGDTFEKVAIVARDDDRDLATANGPERGAAIRDILPAIGKEPIAQVKRDELLTAVRAIEKRGAKDVAL